MNHDSLIRLNSTRSVLAKFAFVFFTASFGLGWLATPAKAITRIWNGASNGYWSEPSNWSPVGTPQNGDDLVFNNAQRSNMTNDIPGLSVRTLEFHHSCAVWGPNDLTVTVGIGAHPVDDGPLAMNFANLVLGA